MADIDSVTKEIEAILERSGRKKKCLTVDWTATLDYSGRISKSGVRLLGPWDRAAVLNWNTRKGRPPPDAGQHKPPASARPTWRRKWPV